MLKQVPSKLIRVEQSELTNITGGCLHCAVDIWINHGMPNDVIARPEPSIEGRIGADFSDVRIHGE